MNIKTLIISVSFSLSSMILVGCTSANSEQAAAPTQTLEQELKIEKLATESEVITAAQAHIPEVAIGE